MKNNGGPAFPWEDKNDDGTYFHTHQGMTLRDYFAGQALASGVVKEAYPEWQIKARFGDRNGITREQIIARASYAIADAMLEARK